MGFDVVTEDLDFSSLEPIQLGFKVGKKQYILSEASGDAHAKWQNAATAARIYQDGKISGYKNLADLDSLLISLCTTEFDPNTKAFSAVPAGEVRNWPHRVVKKVYEKIRKISEFDEDETEEELLKQKEEIEKKLELIKNGKGSAAKNGQSGTQTGSSSPQSLENQTSSDI